MKKEVLDAINYVKEKAYDISLSKLAEYVKLAKREKSSELCYELCCLPDAIRELEEKQFAKKLAKNAKYGGKKHHIRNDLAKVVYKVGDPEWVYRFANEFQQYVNVPKFLKVILDKKDAYYAAEFDRDILSADLKKNEKLREQVFDLVYSTKNADMARKFLTENDYTDKQKLQLFSIIGRETRQKKSEERRRETETTTIASVKEL